MALPNVEEDHEAQQSLQGHVTGVQISEAFPVLAGDGQG